MKQESHIKKIKYYRIGSGPGKDLATQWVWQEIFTAFNGLINTRQNSNNSTAP